MKTDFIYNRLAFKFSQERVSRMSADLISYVAPVITSWPDEIEIFAVYLSTIFRNFPTEESCNQNTVELGFYIILAVYQLVQKA